MSAVPNPSFASDPAAWGAQDPRARGSFDTTLTPRGMSALDVNVPSVRDTSVKLLVALTILLQLVAWWQLDGYTIADSVEFMERAISFEKSEKLIDAYAIRPFGFSFALVPLFMLAKWFGIHDLRAVAWAAVVIEMLLGCVLVVLCTRLATRFMDRKSALVAGFIVATNPVFLQYSVQPESGIPAGVCIALALESVLERRSFKKSLIGGLWLGAAFMTAYKTLLLSGAIFVFVFLRDRFRHTACWSAILVALVSAVLLQCGIDWYVYDSFGLSVHNYAVQNIGSVLVSVFLKTHWVIQKIEYAFAGSELEFTAWAKGRSSWALDVADTLYRQSTNLLAVEWAGRSDIAVRGKMHPWFYVLELPRMLVWPVIFVWVLGVVRSIVRPSWKTTILVGAFALNFLATSNKGTKEFRLWLPALGLIAPICAFGWDWIASGWLARAARLRATLLVGGAAATVVLALQTYHGLNTKHYGGYWKAIDWVNEQAHETLPRRRAEARGTAPEPLRVASTYHWAVFLRTDPLVELVKLPWQLNRWMDYKPDTTDGALKRADNLAALGKLDAFVVHLPVLSTNPDLMRFVGERFDVSGAFYEQGSYEDLGPIFVLTRASAGDPAARFFTFQREADADRLRARLAGQPRTEFVARAGTADEERLEFLGVEYQELGPEHYGWITYHWCAKTKLRNDWRFADRLTSPDERNVWDNSHAPAFGAVPTSTFEPGVIVSEGHLLVPSAEPYNPLARWRPLGAGFRRGELIPLRLWMRVLRYSPADEAAGVFDMRRAVDELLATRPGESLPIRASLTPEDPYQTRDGHQRSTDDMFRVGAFLLPVHPRAALPDDGHPVPD